MLKTKKRFEIIFIGEDRFGFHRFVKTVRSSSKQEVKELAKNMIEILKKEDKLASFWVAGIKEKKPPK